MKTYRYSQGFEAARSELAKGKSPLSVFEQSLGDIDPDDWTRGWQDACSAADTTNTIGRFHYKDAW